MKTLQTLKSKKRNQKGFTLMEMLFVVAIIGILVAIAIPTMNNSLEKAKKAADDANIRSAYAEHQMNVLEVSTEDATFDDAKDTIKFADGTTYELQHYTGIETTGQWSGTKTGS